MKILLSAIASLILLLALAWAGLTLMQPEYPARLAVPASPVPVPALDDSFTDYLDTSRQAIREALETHYYQPGQVSFLGRYTREEVLAMRAPYELPAASDCSDADPMARHGVLLVHGLSDSPYLTRQLATALKQNYFPCVLFRGLLVPGHGTVPGHLRAVDRDDWRQAVDFGVDSFAGEVNSLTVVGYSNGSALALDYLNRHPEQTLIERLVLVVPGLGAESDIIWIAPWLRLAWPWLGVAPDNDAVKYESSSTHAIAEFYHLTNEVREQTTGQIPVPLLMLVSGDDTTVDRQQAVDYFCRHGEPQQSRLFWFAGRGDDEFTPPCNNIRQQPLDTSDPRFVSYSHVALMIPPQDRHYGRDGNYPVCLDYLGQPERYRQCLEVPQDTVYVDGARTDETGLYEGRLARRPTFNPRFDAMVQDIHCFMTPTCQLP